MWTDAVCLGVLPLRNCAIELGGRVAVQADFAVTSIFADCRLRPEVLLEIFRSPLLPIQATILIIQIVC